MTASALFKQAFAQGFEGFLVLGLFLLGVAVVLWFLDRLRKEG